MKSIISLSILFICFFISSKFIFADPTLDAGSSDSINPIIIFTDPTNLEETKDLINNAILAGKSGKWWYLSSLIIMIVMFVIKKVNIIYSKLGRFKYIVVPILSLTAAVFASFQGGVSFESALGVFATGWATGMLEELWNHGILGKIHSQKIVKSSCIKSNV